MPAITSAAPQLNFPFKDTIDDENGHQGITDPSSYKGLYAFHKYWGKKPHEVLGFIIEHLTEREDTVLDPFMGSGTAGRESLLRGRSFIGCDVNPFSLRLAELMLSPPAVSQIKVAFDKVRKLCEAPISCTYTANEKTVDTHFLWSETSLKEVWTLKKGKRATTKRAPNSEDLALIKKYDEYQTTRFRPLRFFTNPRINAFPKLQWRDIFTGRALHNLDLLHTAILAQPEPARGALLLALTASCGQMSKMVFAITGRGKTTGKTSERVEVGSWVIGFWRPKLHFEINVWDCFERRAAKLLKALSSSDPLQGISVKHPPADVLNGKSVASIQRMDCRQMISMIPNESVSLIITDPPHSDRIPYLELSELWNAIIDEEPDFSEELIVSNAKERGKTKKTYSAELGKTLHDMSRILRTNGFLVLVFNARSAEDWQGLTQHMETGNDKSPLKCLGRFPVYYSAGSVVQDNREGGLKHDFAMVFTKSGCDKDTMSVQLKKLRRTPGWEAIGDIKQQAK
jgi:hypothetical protein